MISKEMLEAYASGADIQYFDRGKWRDVNVIGRQVINSQCRLKPVPQSVDMIVYLKNNLDEVIDNSITIQYHEGGDFKLKYRLQLVEILEEE